MKIYSVKIKSFVVVGIFLFLIGMFNITAQESDDWPSFNVCCEKTKTGACCQNTNEANCDEGFRKTPTSCDATSYCKLGTCIDSEEGLCIENSPQKVCEISTGTWIDDDIESTSQCNLGCCFIGDQASFVTQTRCKRLSNIYGLETNFKNNIENEVACIMTAYSSEKGACVFEEEGSRNCIMTTRGNCKQGEGNVSSQGEFFKDYLCSADELGTDCGPTKRTRCVEGKDEVYFLDSCGNAANIYDASKIYSKNPGYWQKIVRPANSCSPKSNTGNAGSSSCGNCDYLSGSICRKGDATYGDYVCKDLNCYDTENGKDYNNGESWCMYQGDVGLGKDLVGSRHFRHVCIHGEETIEPCSDFRNEVCIEQNLQTSDGNFIEAACRVNRWQDCINQFTEDDCLNDDKRDCAWYKGFHYDGSSSSNEKDQNIGELAESDNKKENLGILKGGGVCLPNNPPGLKFWEEGTAKQTCSLGNAKITVDYTKGIIGDRSCEGNCDVLTGKWGEKMNDVCKSLGDCGGYTNIAGKYTDDGSIIKDNGKRRKSISQGIAQESGGGLFGGLFG